MTVFASRAAPLDAQEARLAVFGHAGAANITAGDSVIGNTALWGGGVSLRLASRLAVEGEASTAHFDPTRFGSQLRTTTRRQVPSTSVVAAGYVSRLGVASVSGLSEGDRKSPGPTPRLGSVKTEPAQFAGDQSLVCSSFGLRQTPRPSRSRWRPLGFSAGARKLESMASSGLATVFPRRLGRWPASAIASEGHLFASTFATVAGPVGGVIDGDHRHQPGRSGRRHRHSAFTCRRSPSWALAGPPSAPGLRPARSTRVP